MKENSCALPKKLSSVMKEQRWKANHHKLPLINISSKILKYRYFKYVPLTQNNYLCISFLQDKRRENLIQDVQKQMGLSL